MTRQNTILSHILDKDVVVDLDDYLSKELKAKEGKETIAKNGIGEIKCNFVRGQILIRRNNKRENKKFMKKVIGEKTEEGELSETVEMETQQKDTLDQEGKMDAKEELETKWDSKSETVGTSDVNQTNVTRHEQLKVGVRSGGNNNE